LGSFASSNLARPPINLAIVPTFISFSTLFIQYSPLNRMMIIQVLVAAAVALLSVVSSADPNNDPNNESLWEFYGFDQDPARFDKFMVGINRDFSYDQDGHITPESLHKAVEAARNPDAIGTPSISKQQFIQMIDADGDGKVAKHELREFFERKFRITTIDKLKGVKSPVDAKTLLVRDC
jgi:hypothetical protein